MTSLELLESFAAIKDKYVLEAHDEELPGNNIIPFDNSIQSERTLVHAAKSKSKRRAPMKKSVLVAIIAAAVLCLVGFAYAVIKLQELSLGEYTYTQPNRLNLSEKETVTTEFISLQGLQGSVEYQAAKEWQDFLHSYDTEGEILAEIGNNPTGLEDLGLFYQVYTQEMYDKLEEIADKYDLKLHSEMNLVSQEELDYRVGGSFMGEDLSRGWAYIYENGTFQFDGEALIGDFDNGILKADASHNHTLSEKIWPYTLYKYNVESDSYDVIAQVEAWDKEIRDTDYDGNEFPDDVDADGDQTVYYIMEADAYAQRTPVDGEEYDQWYEAHRNGAGTITIPYMALTEENISKLK